MFQIFREKVVGENFLFGILKLPWSNKFIISGTYV